MRSIFNNNYGSAGLFITVIIMFGVISSVEFVFLGNDESVNVSALQEFDWFFNVGNTSFTLPSNWSDMNRSVRDNYLTNLHGGSRDTVFSIPFISHYYWVGIGYVFSDGTEISANDYGRILEYDPDNLDFNNILETVINVVTLDFELFSYLGWFGWIIKFILWFALIYSLVDVLWFG